MVAVDLLSASKLMDGFSEKLATALDLAGVQRGVTSASSFGRRAGWRGSYSGDRG
jgi:hypothetical protein